MGDGQCDSPRITAIRVLMEMTTGYTIDLEVLNKRGVALKSVNYGKKTVPKNILQIINSVLLLTLWPMHVPALKQVDGWVLSSDLLLLLKDYSCLSVTAVVSSVNKNITVP